MMIMVEKRRRRWNKQKGGKRRHEMDTKYFFVNIKLNRLVNKICKFSDI